MNGKRRSCSLLIHTLPYVEIVGLNLVLELYKHLTNEGCVLRKQSFFQYYFHIHRGYLAAY